MLNSCGCRFHTRAIVLFTHADESSNAPLFFSTRGFIPLPARPYSFTSAFLFLYLHVLTPLPARPYFFTSAFLFLYLRVLIPLPARPYSFTTFLRGRPGRRFTGAGVSSSAAFSSAGAASVEVTSSLLSDVTGVSSLSASSSASAS